jgi:hypothetical protein
MLMPRKKDRLAVEQDLVALHLNGAEADVVVEVIVVWAGLHLDAVELRMLGRPANQPSAARMKTSRCRRASRGLLVDRFSSGIRSETVTFRRFAPTTWT